MKASAVELYSNLIMSLVTMTLLMIFLLFESFPNALSELTYYADREFYQDWWNAVSLEEFYGKWLKFPYLFFYRHVYMELRLTHKYRSSIAKIITNLANAAMQEIIVVSNTHTHTHYSNSNPIFV